MINLRAILSAPLLLITWIFLMLSIWIGGEWASKIAYDFNERLYEGMNEL